MEIVEKRRKSEEEQSPEQKTSGKCGSIYFTKI